MTTTHSLPGAEPPYLPARRSFVVQLSAHVDINNCRFQGRVEHLVSGHFTWFDSVDQLLAFIDKQIQTPGG